MQPRFTAVGFHHRHAGAWGLTEAHCRPEPPATVLQKGWHCDKELSGPGVQQYKFFQSSCRTEHVCDLGFSF